MKFRKKPIVVDAIQWDGNFDGVVRQWFPENPSAFTTWKCCGLTILPTGRINGHGFIETLEGNMIVCPQDWIITGIKGEKYPCKPDIFAATYETLP